MSLGLEDEIAKNILLDKTCNTCRHHIRASVNGGPVHTFCDALGGIEFLSNKPYKSDKQIKPSLPEAGTCSLWEKLF